MRLLRNLVDFLRLNYHLYHFTPERIRQYQEKAVLRLIDLVRRDSPFYRDLYAGRSIKGLADYGQLPAINKEIMMTNFDRLNMAGLRLAEVMDFALTKEAAHDYLGYYQDRYVIGLSSGTSGNKGIFVTSSELTKRLPGVFMARGGVRLSDLPLKILFLLRVFSQGFADMNAPMIKLHYLPSMTEPLEILAEYNRMQANILMAPPSLLRQLLPLYQQIQSPPCRIITYAEVLDPLEKDRFEATFGAPVVEIYQASEGQIASPCRCGNLHINEDLVYVELLDENGRPLTEESGQRSKRMFVTNLVNTVQPLLRYEMNDIIELGGPCPCGSHFRVISRVIGRNDDVLHLRNQCGILRPVYPDLVSRWIITTDDRICEFIVEQVAPDHLLITLDLSDNYFPGDELIDRLRLRLTRELAAFDIQCALTIKIQKITMPTDNRKLKRFIAPRFTL